MSETLLKWIRERPESLWRRWSAAGVTLIAYLGLFTSVHLALGLFVAFMGKGRRESWDKVDLPLPWGSIAVMGLIATLAVGASIGIYRTWRAGSVVLDSLMLWIGLLNSLSVCVIISLRLNPASVLIPTASAVIVAFGVAIAAARHVVRASLDA